VALGPGVGVDLPIVPSLVCLVPEEVDGGVLDAIGPLGFSLYMVQAVCLVPALGEDVEGDLSADRVGQAEIGESFLELGNHLGSDVVLNVVLVVVVALLDAGVTADGGDVDHAVAELDEGAAFYGDVEVGNVVEDPGASLAAGLVSQFAI
jgi:hypothetical protein